MIIKGLLKLSTVDFPPYLSAVVFTFGCNFRCPFCQNPELVIDNGDPIIEISQIIDFARDKSNWINAFTITGGEPTVHKDIIEFCRQIKSVGDYKIKLDTNGSNPDIIKALIKDNLIDYIAMDIKGDRERYKDIANIDNAFDKLIEIRDFLLDINFPFEFRTTIIPGYYSDDEILFMADIAKLAPAYYLQGYRPQKTLDPEFANTYRNETKDSELIRLVNLIKAKVGDINVDYR